MKQIFAKVEKQLKALSKRDQIAMSVIIVVAFIFIWDITLRAPLSESRMVIEHDLKQVDATLLVTQAKMKVFQENLAADPDTDAKGELARYIDENKRLDLALKKTSTQIINPQEMTSMLEQILVNQTGLKFVSLKNMPATQEFTEARTDVADSGETISVDQTSTDTGDVNTIYRHSVILEMEGSYHSILSYLKKLEQFPWRFFWKGIDIETGKYPNTSIILEVYTLGFREGIIGV